MEDPKAEREAWKEHFASISNTMGQVSQDVWQRVTEGEGEATWLTKEPSIVEMDKAIGKMKVRKKPGKDGITAEILKYGGKKFRKKVYGIVQEMWRRAVNAEDGKEADEWPIEWKLGITVPLWKKKGSFKDKNTWRGITLLSVGSKLLARVSARRLSEWSEGWVCEQQCGFRKGRGVDDSLMVSRRVAEEVVRAVGDDWILMSFFDIEKAYPRVCKDGVWKLLKWKKCPEGFIKVLKGLHEHTGYRVRIHQGESSTF